MFLQERKKIMKKHDIKIILTTQNGGVKDYSENLNALFKKKGHNSKLIFLNKENRINLLKKISNDDVIIFQMEAYGFQKKGVPLWLLKDLKNLKKKTKNLIIFFHELYAHYNFWHPYFIVMKIQKYICVELTKICSSWITNNKIYSDWLVNNGIKKKNFIFNKESSILIKKENVKKDKKLVIIFGTEASRYNVYKENLDKLENWIKNYNLNVIDIGPRLKNKDLEKQLKKINLQIKGKMNFKDIAKIFSKANFGLFSTTNKVAIKGGIFSAYCKFGIIPINTHNFDKNFKKKYDKYWINFLPNLNIPSNKFKVLRTNISHHAKKSSINHHINIYLNNINL